MAQSALTTLSQLGYARTSLREIAQNSPFSHGVVHYYFADKAELITACVGQYKAVCATRYDEAIESSRTPHELLTRVMDVMSRTVVEDKDYHRMWYDLRNQSLFDAELRDEVAAIDAKLEDMIWRIFQRMSELADVTATIDSVIAYTVFDGAFMRALGGVYAGDQQRALSDLTRAAESLFTTSFPGSGIGEPVRMS